MNVWVVTVSLEGAEWANIYIYIYVPENLTMTGKIYSWQAVRPAWRNCLKEILKNCLPKAWKVSVKHRVATAVLCALSTYVTKSGPNWLGCRRWASSAQCRPTLTGALCWPTPSSKMAAYVCALTPRSWTKLWSVAHTKFPPAFSQARYFTKLDAKAGYWSVKLAPASQELTTFRSPPGRYCFNRLPFVLSVSQDLFQQHMDRILVNVW